MNIETIDLGDEVRNCFQFRFALAPVVICSPIAREFLHRRELDALRGIRDLLSIWPSGGIDAPPQIGKLRIRKVELKRTNRGIVCVMIFSFSVVPNFESANVSAIVRGLNAAARPNTEPSLRKWRRDFSSASFISFSISLVWI